LETYLADLKPATLALAGSRKSSYQLQEMCYPTGTQDLSLLAFKSLGQIKNLLSLIG
jgi:hypothetical protein